MMCRGVLPIHRHWIDFIDNSPRGAPQFVVFVRPLHHSSWSFVQRNMYRRPKLQMAILPHIVIDNLSTNYQYLVKLNSGVIPWTGTAQ